MSKLLVLVLVLVLLLLLPERISKALLIRRFRRLGQAIRRKNLRHLRHLRHLRMLFLWS
ncbi:MAG: hypothetical protein ABI883_07485 [Chthoniobacterales bacterium]